MDRPQPTMMANKFQSVFDASLLNERGNQLEFCWRQRQITPFRFGLHNGASTTPLCRSRKLNLYLSGLRLEHRLPKAGIDRMDIF